MVSLADILPRFYKRLLEPDGRPEVRRGNGRDAVVRLDFVLLTRENSPTISFNLRRIANKQA